MSPYFRGPWRECIRLISTTFMNLMMEDFALMKKSSLKLAISMGMGRNWATTSLAGIIFLSCLLSGVTGCGWAIFSSKRDWLTLSPSGSGPTATKIHGKTESEWFHPKKPPFKYAATDSFLECLRSISSPWYTWQSPTTPPSWKSTSRSPTSARRTSLSLLWCIPGPGSTTGFSMTLSTRKYSGDDLFPIISPLIRYRFLIL